MSTHENPTSFRNGLQPRSTDVFIAVMGVTGSGKSTFISKCCDNNIAIGHSLKSCTSTVDVYPCEINAHTTVYLIDTPGFDDDARSDTEVLKEIATWLTASYTAEIRLNGIIYLHRISDVRMQGSAKKNLFMFKKLCGPNALKNVVLVTTMWDRVLEHEGVTREQELVSTPDFWGWMMDRGSRTYRHSGDRQSAMSTIQMLVQLQASVTLELQQQMANEKKSLNDTDAGKEVQAEVARERKRFEKKLAEVQQQWAEARQAQDEESQQTMKELQKEYNDRIAQLESSTQKLKISMEELHKERYSRLEAKLKETEARYEKKFKKLEKDREKLSKEREVVLGSSMNELASRPIITGNHKPGISLAISGDSFYFDGPNSTYGEWSPSKGSSKELDDNNLRILALGENDTWVSVGKNSHHIKWSSKLNYYYLLLAERLGRKTYGYIRRISLGTQGRYFIHGTEYWSANWNSEMIEHAREHGGEGCTTVCAFGKDDAYILRFEDGGTHWNLKGNYPGLDASLRKKGRNIKFAALSLTHDEYVVAYDNGEYRISVGNEYKEVWRQWVRDHRYIDTDN